MVVLFEEKLDGLSKSSYGLLDGHPMREKYRRMAEEKGRNDAREGFTRVVLHSLEEMHRGTIEYKVLSENRNDVGEGFLL